MARVTTCAFKVSSKCVVLTRSAHGDAIPSLVLDKVDENGDDAGSDDHVANESGRVEVGKDVEERVDKVGRRDRCNKPQSVHDLAS